MYVCMYACLTVCVCVHICIALEHIRKCHNEKDRREQQIEGLKSRIEELNAAIAVCQEKLPASGAPITRQVQTVGSHVCMYV